jgi:hypothetical protein
MLTCITALVLLFAYDVKITKIMRSDKYGLYLGGAVMPLKHRTSLFTFTDINLVETKRVSGVKTSL